jgi:hypothetical protein
MGLQNYSMPVAMTTEKGSIKFNSIKLKKFKKVWHCKKVQNSTKSNSAFVPT